VAALCGLLVLQRKAPRLGNFYAGVFLTYTLYYTLFGPGDYYLMVVPAYFIFFIWVGAGFVWLAERLNAVAALAAAKSVLALLVGVLFVTQIGGRMAMAADRSAEAFANKSFALLPEGVVGVVGYRELTTLTYFQLVHGARPDLMFILPARSVRYYTGETVADYVSYVNDVACAKDIYTLKELPEWDTTAVQQEELQQLGWLKLQAGEC
jgi:hypothetical protein